MLKTTRSFEKLALRIFKAGNNEIVRGDNDRIDEMVVDLPKFKNKKSLKLTCMQNIRVTGDLTF